MPNPKQLSDTFRADALAQVDKKIAAMKREISVLAEASAIVARCASEDAADKPAASATDEAKWQTFERLKAQDAGRAYRFRKNHLAS